MFTLGSANRWANRLIESQGWFWRDLPSSSGPTGLYPRLTTSTGTVFYVSTTGNDTTGNGTVGTPWRTVQKFFDNSANGDICEVAAGTYSNESWVSEGGTALAPKTVRAAAGTRPLFHFTGSGQDDSRMNACSYIRIQGIEYGGNGTDSNTLLWLIGDCHHIEFFDCWWHDGRRSNVFSEYSTHDIHYINCKSYLAGRRQEATHNLDHGWYLGGDRHMLVNCLSYDNDAFGLQFYDAADGSIVSHSVFDGNGKAGIIIAGADTTFFSKNCRVYDNILSNNGTYGITDYWGGTIGYGNIVANNITYNNAFADYDTPVEGYVLASSIEDTDPVFVDRAGKNFAVLIGSPAQNAATQQFSLAFDYSNISRVNPDIGAYEAVAAVTIPILVMPPMVVY